MFVFFVTLKMFYFCLSGSHSKKVECRWATFKTRLNLQEMNHVNCLFFLTRAHKVLFTCEFQIFEILNCAPNHSLHFILQIQCKNESKLFRVSLKWIQGEFKCFCLFVFCCVLSLVQCHISYVASFYFHEWKSAHICSDRMLFIYFLFVVCWNFPKYKHTYHQAISGSNNL